MQRGLVIVGIALVLGMGVVAGCASNPTTSSNTIPTTSSGSVTVVSATSSTTANSTTSSNTTPTTSSRGVTVPSGTRSTTVNITVHDACGQYCPGPTMTLVATPATAKAGDVTFIVKNTGTIDHEVVVLKTDTAFDKLPITYGGDPPAPVTSGANKVSEANKVGETGNPDLKPGETRTFTIKNMTAGKYVLLCNLVTHYGKGLRAPFTVT